MAVSVQENAIHVQDNHTGNQYYVEVWKDDHLIRLLSSSHSMFANYLFCYLSECLTLASFLYGKKSCAIYANLSFFFVKVVFWDSKELSKHLVS